MTTCFVAQVASFGTGPLSSANVTNLSMLIKPKKVAAKSVNPSPYANLKSCQNGPTTVHFR